MSNAWEKKYRKKEESINRAKKHPFSAPKIYYPPGYAL
jgi:hypothetical protein